MQLHNKVAIVTGAASGIGKAIAHHFVDEGASRHPDGTCIPSKRLRGDDPSGRTTALART